MKQIASKALLVFCFAYSSTLMMEEKCSSEMQVDFEQTTRLYSSKNRILHNYDCENFSSCIFLIVIISAISEYIRDLTQNPLQMKL
jgi:hypothetical protein